MNRIKQILILAGIVTAIFFLVLPKNQDCMGQAECFSGKVTEIMDGDTIKVNGKSIRFALTSTPEIYSEAGAEVVEFLEKTCPVGSIVLVDEDDGQTSSSYGRLIGMIRCNGQILNQAILDEGFGRIILEFCSVSEFSNMIWAKKHGC